MKTKIRGLVFVGFAAAVFAQSALAVSTDDKTVTSKTYVDAYAQAQADRVMSTTVQSSDWQSDEKYPSMKLLSQSGLTDAQPKAETLVDSTTNELEQNAAWIGWHYGDNNENEDWVKLQGVGYTEIVHDANKGHFVQLDSNKIAATGSVIAGSNGQGPLSTDEGDLTTAKAVYEFVTGNGTNDPDDGFQRKVATAEAGEVMIGYRTVTGTGSEATYGDSTWYSMKEGQQHGVNSVPFVRISKDETNSEVFVDLHRDRIIGSDGINQGTGYYTSGIDGTNAGNRLATGIAVYNYAVPMNWTERVPSGYANKKLVTDSSGNVILAEDTTANIPSDMPDECDTASGTHVCALVAYWGAAEGTSGEPGYIPAGVRYEWTIMAPTGNNG